MARAKVEDLSTRQALAEGETDQVVGGYYGGWGCGPSYYHNTGHADYHWGGFYPHGGHYDYQPGHYDWHNTGHWH